MHVLKFRLFALVVILLIFISGCSVSPVSDTAFVLDTAVSITVYDGSEPAYINEAFLLCSDYENILSRTLEDSEISILNKNGTAEVSAETAELIEEALDFCSLTDGALDITVGSVSRLWDFHAETPSLPDEKTLKAALKTVDCNSVSVNGTSVTLEIPDAAIDLGAVAKGWIADKVKEDLIRNGVKSALIDLGGNILCIGEKQKDKPFVIGIYDPVSDEVAVYVELCDDICSVVTSGTYQRKFIIDEKLYHHILDPETGYPIENNLASVTILSKDSFTGDALSTACFVLGLRDGMELIDSIDGVYAVFIENDGTVHYSAGLTDKLKIID